MTLGGRLGSAAREVAVLSEQLSATTISRSPLRSCGAADQIVSAMSVDSLCAGIRTATDRRSPSSDATHSGRTIGDSSGNSRVIASAGVCFSAAVMS
jgi:hypothetical protein